MALRLNKKRRRRKRVVKYVIVLIGIIFTGYGLYAYGWISFPKEPPKAVRSIEPVGQLQLLSRLTAESRIAFDESLQRSGSPAPYSHFKHVVRSFARSADLPYHRVRLRYEDGTMILDGVVGSLETRNQFEVFVRQIRGVRHLENRLRVLDYPKRLSRR